MLEYRGKYNTANVMLDNIEPELVSQIYSFLNHPAFEGGYIAIMPDCHVGNGSCIGFTKQMNNYVIPNIVGVDLGCGIDSYCMGQMTLDDRDLGAFETFIRNEIPSGFSLRNNQIKEWWKNGPFSIDPDTLEGITNSLELDYSKVVRSLGTLGGGNHFIELDKDFQDRIWVTVHTGSRNFGLQVCNHYQRKAKALMNEMFIGDAYKGLEFLPMDKGGLEYISHMQIAQDYAQLNRVHIVNAIITYFCAPIHDVVYTVHNYISLSDNIIRKGAISAKAGERVLIPLNMRDGVIVGTGKGNNKWNKSAPHGAGRILSRKRAKELITLEKMKEDMKGIYSQSLNTDTRDEAPGAYKDSQLIIDSLQETVDIDFIMKPIYNFKAGGE
jgi:tRNA-splicing ligase RtcB